jgi:hypothetical protein
MGAAVSGSAQETESSGKLVETKACASELVERRLTSVAETLAFGSGSSTVRLSRILLAAEVLRERIVEGWWRAVLRCCMTAVIDRRGC